MSTAPANRTPEVVVLATGGAPRNTLLAALTAYMDSVAATTTTAAPLSRLTSLESLSTARHIAEVRATLERDQLPEQAPDGGPALRWTWHTRDNAPHSFIAPQCSATDFAAIFGDEEAAPAPLPTASAFAPRLSTLRDEIFSARYVLILVNLTHALEMKHDPGAHLARVDVEQAPAAALTRLAAHNIRAVLVPVFDAYAAARFIGTYGGDLQRALAESLPLLAAAARATATASIPVEIAPAQTTPLSQTPGIAELATHTDYFLANGLTLEENAARELLRTDESKKDWIIVAGFVIGAVICGGAAFLVARDSLGILAAAVLIGGSFGAGMSIVCVPSGSKGD